MRVIRVRTRCFLQSWLCMRAWQACACSSWFSRMSKSRSNEIRGGFKDRFVGSLGGLMIWLLNHSLNIKISNESDVDFSKDPSVIIVLWHDQLVGGLALIDTALSGRQHVALTSASRDGGMLASAFRVLGIDAARGSSSRRGAAALVALRRAIKSGSDITITPDGPRGPRRKLQGGVVQLASLCGAKIIPLEISYEDAWTLKTWDKLQIPKPFSRMTIRMKKSLAIPPKLDEAALAEWSDRLNSELPSP